MKKLIALAITGALTLTAVKAIAGNGMSLGQWGYNDIHWVMLPVDTVCGPEKGFIICRQRPDISDTHPEWR